jgi:hypothetical protein
MRKLQWKPSEERDTLPLAETLLLLTVLAVLAIILRISGIL